MYMFGDRIGDHNIKTWRIFAMFDDISDFDVYNYLSDITYWVCPWTPDCFGRAVLLKCCSNDKKYVYSG